MRDTPSLNRRSFLRAAGAGACALSAAPALGADVATDLVENAKPRTVVHEAMWYERLPDKAVRCLLCPRECVVAEVERGYCGVRENQAGDYKTLVYGTLCSVNMDPIEKKPLYHYLPATPALSVATAGCNMECKFCQNWRISQYRPEQVESLVVPPENLVRVARNRGAPTMAFTYSEPVIFYEYMHDAAAEGRKHGVGSVMISNGYIREDPMRQLARHLTGVKVDLKAFTETFYADQCAGHLQPVLHTLEVLADLGMHTEIVVLLIPTLNDSMGEIRQMATWIAKHMGPDVPLHFSRFHPTYRVKNLPPTPITTLDRARKTAMDAGLHFVYVGNVPFHEGGHRYCPGCGKPVIRRVGYRTDTSNLSGGKCGSCGRKIPGVWSQGQALAFKVPEGKGPKTTPGALRAEPG